MQNVIAVAVAAAIVTGGAVYIAQMPKPPASEIGRFHFIANGGNALWQLDTQTGEVKACLFGPGKDEPVRGCADVSSYTIFDSTPPGEDPFAKYHQPPAKR